MILPQLLRPVVLPSGAGSSRLKSLMQSNSAPMIAVGLSGGVDSTMAAYLLKQAGARLVGLTMQIWDESLSIEKPIRSGCFGPGEAADIEGARQVAARLDIPHHVIPLKEEYRAAVVEYFRKEYRAGRTPNPCVTCNRRIKFDLLLERARAAGIAFDRFATGHYARTAQDSSTGRIVLRRAADRAKDQSYFLALLSQAQLRAALFPLGDLTKDAVKTMARECGFADVAAKNESQDFLEADDYSVLFSSSDSRPGPILDSAGRILGRHRGLIHYTVGQRRGLLLGGTKEPLYVLRLDPDANAVIVGPRQSLQGRILAASGLNWILRDGPPKRPIRIEAKIRQQHQPAPATLYTEGPDRVRILFDEPQSAITPGQVVVFYQEDIVLGAGFIFSTDAADAPPTPLCADGRQATQLVQGSERSMAGESAKPKP